MGFDGVGKTEERNVRSEPPLLGGSSDSSDKVKQVNISYDNTQVLIQQGVFCLFFFCFCTTAAWRPWFCVSHVNYNYVASDFAFFILSRKCWIYRISCQPLPGANRNENI